LVTIYLIGLKKAEKRAKYIYRERENIETKIDFYSNLHFAIESAKEQL